MLQALTRKAVLISISYEIMSRHTALFTIHADHSTINLLAISGSALCNRVSLSLTFLKSNLHRGSERAHEVIFFYTSKV